MQITTIIPTLCEASRKQSLLTAIKSIQDASAMPVQIIVVVNGQRFDPVLLASLQQRTDIKVIQIAEGSAVKAQLTGRRLVETKYFSFLDDDDLYLPGALDLRKQPMEENDKVDVVVTNGIFCQGAAESPVHYRLDGVTAAPLYELFQENWLSSCNSLFRTATVDVAMIEDAHPCMEWTWLAFRMTLSGKTVVALPAQTFRRIDTPGSLSKSKFFNYTRLSLYRRMLDMHPPPAIVAVIKEKICSSWHELSESELRDGKRLHALYAHVRSLIAHRDGYRYLPYTRHLLGRSGIEQPHTQRL